MRYSEFFQSNQWLAIVYERWLLFVVSFESLYEAYHKKQKNSGLARHSSFRERYEKMKSKARLKGFTLSGRLNLRLLETNPISSEREDDH